MGLFGLFGGSDGAADAQKVEEEVGRQAQRQRSPTAEPGTGRKPQRHHNSNSKLIRGPKALLSAAIANALDEYFVVDADSIESNLLTNTRIVLHDATLRPILNRVILDKNTAGRPTLVGVSGTVQEVTFSWEWTASGRTWIKDASLTVKGLRFRAKLEHGDSTTNASTTNLGGDNGGGAGSTVEDIRLSTDAETQNEIKREGGIKSYIQRHVEYMIESLTLRIVDFKFTLEVVAPAQSLSDSGMSTSTVAPNMTSAATTGAPGAEKAPSTHPSTLIAFGGELATLLSFGREAKQEGEVIACDSSGTPLKQTIELAGLYSNVMMESVSTASSTTLEEKAEVPSPPFPTNTIPFLEPFSYQIEVTRYSGKRFDDVKYGLQVKGVGGVDTTNDAGLKNNHLVFHVDQEQISTFQELGIMMLADPASAASDSKSTYKKKDDDKQEEETAKKEGISTCDFTFPSVCIIARDMHEVRLTHATMKYMADGTLLDVDAKQFVVVDKEKASEMRKKDNCSRGMNFVFTGIHCSAKPQIAMRIDSIDSLCIPQSFELLEPLYDIKFGFQGETLMMNFDDTIIEGCVLSQKKSIGPKESSASSASASTGEHINVHAPFPVNFSLKKLLLKKEEDLYVEFEMSGVEVFLNPCSEEGEVGMQIACAAEMVRNKLMRVENLHVCTTWPLMGQNCYKNLTVAADSIHVTGGRSTQEWEDAMVLRNDDASQQDKSRPDVNASLRTEPPSKSSSSVVYHLPNAHVEAIKIYITFTGKLGIGINNASLTVKPFVGNEDTTSNDILNYYVCACLFKFPNFVTNAEVFGSNVVEAGAGAYMATLLTPSIGGTAGIVVMTSFDAVKGGVEAGKRGRTKQGDESDKWPVTDFFRGVCIAAAESTQRGAQRRGKKEGDGTNPLDWATGASADTSKYVVDNKARIGGAGAAGVGAAAGMMIAGPVGAIFGGLVTSRATEKTINKLEGVGSSLLGRKKQNEAK